MSVRVRAPHPIPSTAFEPPTRYVNENIQQVSQVPEFESILPILSRLPRRISDPNDIDGVAEDDYITKSQHNLTPGTLADGQRPVLYTVSRLPIITPPAEHLWRALHNLRPLTADYAGDFGNDKTAPTSIPSGCPFSRSSLRSRTALDLVRSIFNWDELVLPPEVEGTFYGVVFRSKRREGSESSHLYRADKLSHEEAVTSGGLLVYWYGVPDPRTGSNLATCIWTGREEARVASRLPAHREAALCARDAYQSFELSRYAVVKRKGETSVRLETWVDEP